jgi:hypothetical protein
LTFDHVTLERKSIVIRWTIVGYGMPNINAVHLMGEAGSGKIDVSLLSSQYL